MTREYVENSRIPSHFVNNIERRRFAPSPHLPSLTRAAFANLICNQNHFNRRPLGTDAGGNGRENVLSSRGALATPFANSLQTAVRDQCTAKPACATRWCAKAFSPLRTSPGVRGQDEFVRVSWEQALDLIDAQHRRIRESYGPASIFAGSYGWRSNGVLHKAATLLQRYMSSAGGYTGHLGDYSTGAAQAIMPYVVGGNEVYQQQTSWPLVLEHSEVVVLWSANPLNTLKIARNASDEQGIPWFDRLRQSGKRLICIDPMRSETVDFFGDSMEWIAPHMGTDVALMLGIAHTLVENGWQDDEFLARCASGYEIFARYLTGESDGVAKTADWAAAICGVSADKIRELAKLFHENTTMLMSGWGMQRQQYGEQKHWMLVTRRDAGADWHPGAGLDFPTISPTAATRPAARRCWARCRERGRRRGRRGEDPGRADCRGAGASGCGVSAQRHGAALPDIRFIWWAGGASFTHHRDTNRLIQAGRNQSLSSSPNASGPPPRVMPISFCRRPPRLSATI